MWKYSKQALMLKFYTSVDYACIFECMDAGKQVRTCVRACVRMYACMYVCGCMLYVCIYVYVCVCRCVCVSV